MDFLQIFRKIEKCIVVVNLRFLYFSFPIEKHGKSAKPKCKIYRIQAFFKFSENLQKILWWGLFSPNGCTFLISPIFYSVSVTFFARCQEQSQIWHLAPARCQAACSTAYSAISVTFYEMWNVLFFVKSLKLPGANFFLPGAKPFCQVPNLALGTQFRNTVLDFPHRAMG